MDAIKKRKEEDARNSLLNDSVLASSPSPSNDNSATHAHETFTQPLNVAATSTKLMIADGCNSYANKDRINSF